MPEAMRRRTAAMLAIALYLVLGVLYVEAVPPWEAPDEPWHLAYAEAVAGGHWPSSETTYEAHQPPFYYLVLAGALRGLDMRAVPRAPDNPWYPFAVAALWHAPDDPAVAVLRLLRQLSGLLGVLTVALAWATARVVAPRRRGVPAMAALVVAVLPQYLFVAHTINNDGLAAVAGGLAAYGLVRWVAGRHPLPGTVAALAAAASLAVGAKVTAWPVFAALPVAAWLAARPGSTRRSGAGANGRTNQVDARGLAGGVPDGAVPAAAGKVGGGRRDRAVHASPGPRRAGRTAVWAPLVGVVAAIAATWTALAVGAPEVVARIASDAGTRLGGPRSDLGAPWALVGQVARLATAFVGRFGWLNVDLPDWAYLGAAALAAAAALGLAIDATAPERADRNGVAVLAVVTAAVMAAVVRNLMVDPQPQGRLAFGALVAVAVLAAVGWSSFGPALGCVRGWPLAHGLIMAAALSANLIATQSILPRAYAPACGPRPEVAVRIMPADRSLVAGLDGTTRLVSQSLVLPVPLGHGATVAVAIADASGPGEVVLSIDGPGGLRSARHVALADVAPNRWLEVDLPAAVAGGAVLTVTVASSHADGRLRLWGGRDDPYPGGALSGGAPDADLALVVARRAAGRP